MDWRDIPSLSALRAFEAAGRHGTFSAAARELNVTHAAIAQHVRGLEAHLGASLLVREGRGVRLTDAGRRLAGSLSEGFARIAAAVRDVRDDVAGRPLAITVTPSFAENWLMPRLGGFWAAHPEVQISISPNTAVVDLRRDGFALGIRYGRGDWPGLEAEQLIETDYTIVAAPSLLAGRDPKGMADLQDLPWIFETLHQEAQAWVTALGLDLECCGPKHVATLGMLLPAVRAGAGLSVVASALIADDIARGTLIPLWQERREAMGYYIVRPSGALTPTAQLFRKWLLAQAA
ncbi:LysR substrate-binding domain-containing protein [Yoonia sp. SS1-5]|uniref:LysR substrate-binding domain-containing protein n=1 Tax=Yoonia rhodophyticola TaxID=3137370 RepID=A0AAN0NJ38_9RHOB